MFKKLLSLALAVCIVAVPVASYAEDVVNIQCELSENQVNVGDEFYADFVVTENEGGYNAMTAYVSFDPKVIQPVECTVPDIPEDLIVYNTSDGIVHSLFSHVHINSRIKFVPKRGDRDYDGYADGQKTAGEIGIVKLSAILSATEPSADGSYVLANYTGTGVIARFKFRAIADGTSEISMYNMTGSHSTEEGAGIPIEIYANSATVTVGSGIFEEPSTEVTTTEVTTTEPTTAANSVNNNNSSGGGGSAVNKETTTVETTAEVTTEEPATSSNAADNSNSNSTSLSFTDVADNFWGRDYIYDMASKGVVNGYPDSTFRPNNNVTRADFIIMLLRGMGIDISKAPQSNFTDVNTAKYYANAIGIAKDMGIASGNGDGTFSPESNITRQDMMILAKKALEIKTGSALTGDASVLEQFSDKADISPYAVDSLAAMVSEGIVNGMGDGIAPKANTTRVQAVVIISKIMDKIG